ncbi:hypothetical protein COCNU_08G006990 [Cocos nucifera]|uniref:Kinesin motor domain-containing protein n=1 Tax=Cocos nucifera TaxID=13894 RepID=A0A8K0IHQ3_COCNU|nr:hypothetical protein COCNU_08G006990 [Cocos nucifera]
MASGSYRNGGAKLSAKLDRQHSAVYSTPKTSAKSRPPATPAAASGLRRSGGGNPASIPASNKGDAGVPGRVRVAVRLRPRNAEELVADADFADCVELQPELKRLKLRKNNWDSETYEFDEVLTEFASQKRVYEVVAKPVVESVLEGYNGTVMAYGQTGTGKTFTLGRLGEEDNAARGIMVRAMEDILADTSPDTDSISVSYFQLYMETIQDLLVPGNDNIAIVEDPKTGDVSLPGATIVEIRDQRSFIELLRLGEAHRFAANTKLNTESSRSHAILMVHVKRSIKGRHDAEPSLPRENGNASPLLSSLRPPIVRKSKLVVVDLAGSERIDKSGSEGHSLEEAKSINLSLSALGKCINSLAENSPHVPFRDSKLTRLLRDSFGGFGSSRRSDIAIHDTSKMKFLGTARTSLVVTIGPSPRHRGETASTVMFGQRAMKVENMVKLKEEFDYKSLCRRLDIEIDKLIAANERQLKDFEDEAERIRADAQSRIAEAERNYMNSREVSTTSQKSKTTSCISLASTNLGRVFMFQEIMDAMNKFDESLFLDLGGFGKVYKGTLENGTKVAVERGNPRFEQGLAEFHTEIEMLSKLWHHHLVSLIGYCDECSEMILVYKYMANGLQREENRKILVVLFIFFIQVLEREDDEERREGTERRKERGKEKKTKREEGRGGVATARGMGAEVAVARGSPMGVNERSKYQTDYLESIKKLEERWRMNQQSSNNDKTRVDFDHEQCSEKTCNIEGSTASDSEEITRVGRLLLNEKLLRESTEEVNHLKSQVLHWKNLEASASAEIIELRKMLDNEANQKQKLEEEIRILKGQLLQLSVEADKTRRSLESGGSGKSLTGLDSLMSQARHSQLRDSGNGPKASIAKLFEQVGLQKILSLLESEDADVRIHAVKVVANLAAEEANQEKIVEAGGLTSLLTLLRSSEDETIRRVAAGAIANLAMNETNQELIMAQSGISLLSMTAADADDPQTLRMVAGAVANLCGNGKSCNICCYRYQIANAVL